MHFLQDVPAPFPDDQDILQLMKIYVKNQMVRFGEIIFKGSLSMAGYNKMIKRDIIQTLSRFKNENQNKYGIRSIGIFGSAARDSLREQSDIDVVVKLDDPDLFNLIGIKQDLEERFHCTVDVIRYRNGMNRFLKHRIDQEAVYA